MVGFALGGALGFASWRTFLRRTRRRRALLAQAFPARWREFLLERYDHYERLDADWRTRFEHDVRIFVAEKRITGIGLEVTPELRLLVAASAVTLSVGWPDYVFAFHDGDEIGPRMLARIAKQSGLTVDDL